MKDIKKHVSNVNSNIYTIKNLNEEQLAVCLSYISRKDETFKDNIKNITQEASDRFHNKYVVGFGHGSTAEHAMMHIALENIPKFVGIEIVKTNKFISLTEKSYRYQKNVMIEDLLRYTTGDIYYIKKYVSNLFNLYNDLIEYGVKQEFARYVLPMYINTSMAITANARAISDCLYKLSLSKFEETRKIGNIIHDEVSKDFNVLLKLREDLNNKNENILRDTTISGTNGDVELIDIYEYKANHNMIFTFSAVVSICCYCQLIRHRSLTIIDSSKFIQTDNINYKSFFGNEVKMDKKLIDIFNRADKISEEYILPELDGKKVEILDDKHDDNLNSRLFMSLRGVYIMGDLKGLKNFLRLRTKKDAQYEIRDLAKKMEILIKKEIGDKNLL